MRWRRLSSQGLRDLSVSRTSFDWGVKVPSSETHVMYVWVDALTNYVTGLGFPDETGDFATYLAEQDLHLIGKDIRALSHDLLARVPDERGAAGSKAGVRSRLPAEPRQKEIEVCSAM